MDTYGGVSSSPEELQFTLNEIQKNTISNNNVVAALPYTLKNQNVIRVPCNTPDAITPNSDITVRFDKSYLSSNSYLNRCKMVGKVKVALTGTVNSAVNNAGTAIYPLAASYNATTGLFTGSYYPPRLWDNTNTALKPFILNKMLTKRDIDFSGKSIQSQTFNDSSELEEVSCLYDQETLEKLGICPEQTWGVTGVVSDVYGPAPNIPSFHDRAQSALVAYKNNTGYLTDQPMYKRNTNGQYYRVTSNQYYKSDGTTLIGGFTYVYNGAGLATATQTGTATYVKSYNLSTNPHVDITDEGIVFAGGTTLLTASVVQVVIFEVFEDLISDLFTNIYVAKPRYYAMNSSELNFRFTQSNVMNTLVQKSVASSGASIASGGIVVTLTDLKLEFQTFNMGTVQVPFRNFEIPFFMQEVNRQTKALTSGAGTVAFPIIQYTTVPHYIKIDATHSYGQDNQTGWQYLSNVIGMSSLSLDIDNDIGMPLQQMTFDALQRRSLKNIGEWKQNWNRIVYKAPLKAQDIVLSGGTLPPNYFQARYAAEASNKTSDAPILPFLLLKVGEDIRLPAGIEPGMRETVNFKFTITFTSTALPNSGNVTAECKIVSYTCAKYVISPRNGLLDTTQISFSRDEWIRSITDTNEAVKSMDVSRMNEYQVPSDMVLGGSWFSVLQKNFTPILRGVKQFAKFVGNVSHHIPHPVSSTIGTISKGVYNTLDRLGYGEQEDEQSHRLASGRKGRAIKYV